MGYFKPIVLFELKGLALTAKFIDVGYDSSLLQVEESRVSLNAAIA